jgi:hypothetical protein
MRKQALLQVITGLLVAFLLFASGCQSNGEQFELVSVTITPSSVGAGEPVTVTVEVNNSGDEVTYPLTLRIDGSEEETREVLVASGASEVVSFQVTRETLGSYHVQVDGISRTFEVVMSAEQAMDRAAEEIAAASSFHFELSHQGGETPIAMGLNMKEAAGDVVRPDKLQATISAILSGMYFEVDFVTVDQSIYMTNPLTGNWEPLPIEFSALKLFDPGVGISSLLMDVTAPVVLGNEKAGGVACHHIKGEVESTCLRAIFGGSVLAGLPVQAEFWVGEEDFLLRQIRLEGRLTADECDGIVRTMKLSRFNQPVLIELPR